jgi:mRNA interferase RelE/StbE
MEYEVVLAPAAEKALDAIPRKPRARILDALEELRGNPRPRGCVKLQGVADLWRIRVGQYRIVYTVRDEQLTVLILHVAHRKDVYKGL